MGDRVGGRRIGRFGRGTCAGGGEGDEFLSGFGEGGGGRSDKEKDLRFEPFRPGERERRVVAEILVETLLRSEEGRRVAKEDFSVIG